MSLVCDGYSDLSTALMNVSFGKGCMGAPLKACPEHCRMDDRIACGHPERNRALFSAVESKDRFEAE